MDCVAMKRAAQASLIAETRGMTHAQEIAFYVRLAATGPLADFWRSIGGEGVADEDVHAASDQSTSKVAVRQRASGALKPVSANRRGTRRPRGH